MTSASPNPASGAFPEGFVWGSAASAAQTESRSGRGRSNWDVFADTPGIVDDGSTNAVCTRFEQNFPTDIALLAGAGLKAFRFSVAWPRVQPDGPQGFSEAGMATYDRIVDTMLDHGIEPWTTLFHWDVPVWAGDFRSRDIVYRLADYAEIVARRLGDRVKNWIVLNEPNSVALRGYASAVHAPAFNSAEAGFAAIHHQNLAQGLIFKALRELLPRHHRIGTTVNLQPVRGEGNLPENERAALLTDALWNGAFVDPVFGKGYPALVASALSPLIRDGDMQIIAAKPDFLGMNYYSRIYVKNDLQTSFGISQGEPPAGTPKTGYFPFEPEGLTEMLVRLHQEYDGPDIYITETGFAMNDPQPSGGVVEDTGRVAYLAEYLKAAQIACDQGVRLKGLFYWSATDNWEWARGFSKHFGLVHVDRESQLRTPKRSLSFLGACAKANAALDFG